MIALDLVRIAVDIESIEEGALVHGIDVDKLVEALNEIADASDEADAELAGVAAK